MTTVDQQTGSAAINGELWGARAREWAEFQEGKRRVDFEQCIRSTGIGQSIRVLDVGCGAGGFCRLAADAGASVTGIDAAAGISKSRASACRTRGSTSGTSSFSRTTTGRLTW
jgi:2-polyprenyl-3-methyl-5-hydroxy-6-metoxy-1,4-benzoquinol methylase